jgi:hypothetical protein
MNQRLTGRLLAAALIAIAALVGLAGRPTAAAPAAQQTSAFLNVWSRTDLPVAQGQVRRGYVWGPNPTITRNEPWAESPGGQRLVQYWDKARMEITDPNANVNDPFYVTNGRLVYEMTGGLIQTGNNRFDTKPASQEPVAGDTRSANTDTPSYAIMSGLASIFPGENIIVDRTGQPFTAYMDVTGQTARAPYLEGYGVRYAKFIPETTHNIPNRFWEFLNQQGQVYRNGTLVTEPLFNWVSVTGYPIIEPYWVTARVGGQPYAVLVQLYERRVLTYTPLFPPDFQLQMGNVGQHYATWRYSTGSVPSLPGMTALSAPPPPPAFALSAYLDYSR